MDLETLSNRIIDDYDFETLDDDTSIGDALTHYGVKGMKWGVRKDRKPSTKKTNKKNSMTSILRGKNRRYEEETAAAYQARMKRESQERIAKINAKQQADSEKRAIKERKVQQKMLLKSQQRMEKMRIKDAENERMRQASKNEEKKTDVDKNKSTKNMTDQEIRDAINRFKLEQEYRKEKNAANLATSSVMNKTLKGAAVVGGGILLTVGKQIAIKQLSDIGNQNLDAYLVKKGVKKKSTIGDAKGGK